MKIEQGYKTEWDELVADSKKLLDSEYPLLEDEVIIAADEYIKHLELAIAKMCLRVK